MLTSGEDDPVQSVIEQASIVVQIDGNSVVSETPAEPVV